MIFKKPFTPRETALLIFNGLDTIFKRIERMMGG